MVLPFLTQVMVFLTFLAAGVGDATGEIEGVGLGVTGELEGVGVGVADATTAVVGNLLMS